MATTSRSRKPAPELTTKDAFSAPAADSSAPPTDETDRLLRSPENARRLLKSISELESGGGREGELID